MFSTGMADQRTGPLMAGGEWGGSYRKFGGTARRCAGCRSRRSGAQGTRPHGRELSIGVTGNEQRVPEAPFHRLQDDIDLDVPVPASPSETNPDADGSDADGTDADGVEPPD